MALYKSNFILQTLVSFITLFRIQANTVHSQDTTSFTIDRFFSNPTDLTYQGDARVQSGSEALSLAGIDSSGNSRAASVGRVLYSRPVRFWETSSARQATFETTIRFLIRPSTSGAAEGIAFFIAPVGTTIPDGSVGGNLGIFDASTARSIFAVEFDTNYNGWDPNYHHIGIDIESRTSSSVTIFDAGTGQEVTARISYYSNTRTITVFASSDSQTATLSYVFDLKTILPQEVQVGITSSTGWYDSIVGLPEIRSWNFTSILMHDAIKNEDAYIRENVSV